jgi:signal transduction histidine kinase
VVTAREEERRRLRRELHDSLSPALSGLSLSAAALARRTGLPEATELHLDIQEVVQQTRRSPMSSVHPSSTTTAWSPQS